MAHANDDNNLSELVDDDKLGASYPPEEPLGTDAYGVTPAEELIDEPLDERVAREEPDFDRQPPPASGGLGHLVEPDQGMAPDEEKDAVASEAEHPEAQSMAVDDLVSGDETTRDAATERVDDLTAEEQAMHITEGP